jgi:hypothetical protein
MKAIKTCENGHENEFINKFCNKCGYLFKDTTKPEFGSLSSKITMKKQIVTDSISKAFLINESTLIYKSDRKYYLFRFTDHKKEVLTEAHSLWNYGTEIEEDSLSTLYLIKDNVVTSLSKRFFDNNQILDNFGDISDVYIDTSTDFAGKNSSITAINSLGYVYSGQNISSITGSESFEFEFPIQSIVFEEQMLIAQNGVNLCLFDKTLNKNEKYTHTSSVDKIILSEEDIVLLDQNGDVFTADKKDFSKSVHRLTKLKNIHSILTTKHYLLAISYNEITIIDFNTTETVKVIGGTFEQGKVWLVGDNILTLEKTPAINSYSICVYKFMNNEMNSRVLNRHEFDGVLIKDIFFVKEMLSKLIINFKGSDDVKYLAMVEI